MGGLEGGGGAPPSIFSVLMRAWARPAPPAPAQRTASRQPSMPRPRGPGTHSLAPQRRPPPRIRPGGAPSRSGSTTTGWSDPPSPRNHRTSPKVRPKGWCSLGLVPTERGAGPFTRPDHPLRPRTPRVPADLG